MNKMSRTLTIICEHCGKEFESSRKKRFCSDKCMFRNRYERLSEQIKEYQKIYREKNKKQKKIEKICEYCGSNFIPVKNNQKFCCDNCRINFYNDKKKKYNHCVVCGEKIPQNRKSKYCSNECYNKAHLEICKECGKEFISHSGQIYCSPECANNAQRDKTLYVCKQCGKTFHRRKTTKDQCLFCSRECSAKYKSEHRPMVQREFFFGFETKCIQCGKTFFSNNGQAKFCSDECVHQWKNEHAKPIHIYYHECQQCGKKFVTANKNQKYCSIECQNKTNYKKHEIVRRTRKRINGNADYSISLQKLVIRDNGVCALCGKPVDMSLDTNNDYYGSIDHIIPLSKDGRHTWDNVQLAHRICNSVKRDKTDNCNVLY